jgi:hypothetical protein
MDRLFKFVGILCVGTAILSVFIPTNRKVERITIKEVFERVKDFDIAKTTKYDLSTPPIETIETVPLILTQEPLKIINKK